MALARWCLNFLSRHNLRMLTRFAGCFMYVLHHTYVSQLSWRSTAESRDLWYRREWSFDSEAETPTTTFFRKLLHTTLCACFLFLSLAKREGKKANNLMEIGPPSCCGNSMFGALNEGTPNRDKNTQTKERPKRRRRYHPCPLFPFLPFLHFTLLPFYLFYPLPFLHLYPFLPLALFITFAFFNPCRHFYPNPFTLALCSTTQKERWTSRSSSFWSGRLCVLSLAEFPSVFGWVLPWLFVSWNAKFHDAEPRASGVVDSWACCFHCWCLCFLLLWSWGLWALALSLSLTLAMDAAFPLVSLVWCGVSPSSSTGDAAFSSSPLWAVLLSPLSPLRAVLLCSCVVLLAPSGCCYPLHLPSFWMLHVVFSLSLADGAVLPFSFCWWC